MANLKEDRTIAVAKVRRHRSPVRLIANAVIALALVFFLSPFYWLVITAVKYEGDNFHKPPYFWPPNPTLENFRTAITGHGTFQGTDYQSTSVLSGIKDSLIVAGANTLISVTLGLLAAYAICRLRTGGARLAFWILSNRFVPPIVFVVPQFLLLRSIGLLDTYAGLILVYLSFNLPFATWFLLSYLRGLPIEIEEAAAIDGCRRLGIIFRIVLPLAAPGIAVTALFCFVFAWNEFTLAFLLSGRNVTTVTVLLPKFAGSFVVLLGVISTASLLAIIPAIILAVFMERYTIRGFAAGAYR
jgi:multiple sugar transport system permease protein